MSKKVLFPSQLPQRIELAKRLMPEGYAMEVLNAGASETELVEALRKSDYLLGFTRHRWSPRVYDAAASLKLIQLLSAGYDRVDLREVARIGVPVCQNGGANSTGVAEHAVLLALAVCRRLLPLDRAVRAGKWIPPEWREPFELEGKTVGLVGLGTIGRKVARMMRGFEANVQYYDAFPLQADQAAALGVTLVSLDDLLRTSDIVSLHVPLTDQTRGLIGERALGLMKPSAILISTCRGGVVDEAALYKALVSGTIAGAGLDVLAEEPAPAGHPLFELDNVVLTPHIAGATQESWSKRLHYGFENMQRIERGEPPLWLVPELRQLSVGA